MKQGLIKELIYGIQASKDVKLSNIGRALQEDIVIIKPEGHLSRNLNDDDFEHINSKILRFGDDKINESMVIAIDPGDIMKPYAKAMEKLYCIWWDGSQGEKAKGYLLCQVTAANLEHNKVVPVYCEAYSSMEDNYPNSTDKTTTIINEVVAS